MMNRISRSRTTTALLTVLLVTFSSGSPAAESACPPASGVAVQVLGSGGPVADDARASSSYLVWIDGRARVMVDAGGGSFLRFGQAGARFADLELLALSHYHTDHAAGLPALLKSGYFSDRSDPLTLAGPSAGGPFPGLDSFLQGLLSPDAGAFGYLAGYLDGSNGLVRLQPVEVNHASREEKRVLETTALTVSALGVSHGIVPAVAYRVEAGPYRIVFGSDQNGKSTGFTRFAGDADLLVAHMAIPETAGSVARRLHATPSAIGAMAAEAKVKKLVLSHFMARSLANLENNIDLVRQAYPGKLVAATDLACIVP
jgi:ribonuclease BN (tRNA processing enzyme)